MALRRGFKTEAREIAAEVRAEIGIGAYAPLDPWALAEHLEIPVWPLGGFRPMATDCVATLHGPCHGQFHAMIALTGRRRVIIHNDRNAITRQRSDICHELAHALLLHQPQEVAPGEPLEYDEDQEDEAAWLGGVLLVTEDGCLDVCRQGLTLQAAATRFGVSAHLMRWRLNKSGAQVRVAREKR